MDFRQASFLVVDDSPTMRHLVMGMLETFGAAHIDYAEDGEAALAKIKQADYTLIISDWNMQPVDGLALLRAVIPLQKPRFNRFIFMTSESSYGHRASAKIDGADDFIVKPFKIATLNEKINRILARI